MLSMGKIRFEPLGKDVNFTSEPSVLEVALKNKIPIDNSCGGSGSCGTCRIFVQSDLEKLEPRNDVEQAMADDRGFPDDERLACQICPHDGLIVDVP